MKVKDIPIQDRPREKLCELGAENLSSSELLAIILQSGTKEKSATELAYELLTTLEDITKLETITQKELCQLIWALIE